MILACELYGVSHKTIQKFTLFFSTKCLFLSVTFLIFFDRTITSYQSINIGQWGSYHYNFAFGIDGISLFFVLLSTFLVPLCLLTSWKREFKLIADYCFYFIMLEIFLILSFAALDIITFFVFFESILIPMFFIIGI
jgi:NADH-quinone oxidoreductase subunit M